jgi:hypothetical protein
MVGMVINAGLTSHYRINNHHHRSQFLPIELTHCALSSPSHTFFGRYRHWNTLARRDLSFPRNKGKLNAAINNPAAAGAAATAPPQELLSQASLTQDYTSIGDILTQVHHHSCIFNTTKEISSITLSGTGVQLGMDATWVLQIRSDGAFREDVSSPFVTFSSGFNADFTNNSTAWDVDSSGVCHKLQLDDHQATVLTTWIRSGVWSLPSLRPYLDIEVLDQDTNTTNNNENIDTNSSSSNTNFVTLAVRLQSGRVAVHVKINTTTWHPESAKVIMCGDSETWEFVNWKHWDLEIVDNTNTIKEVEKVENNKVEKKTLTSTVPSPEKFVHHSMNGGSQSLTITNIEITKTAETTTSCSDSIPIQVDLEDGGQGLLPLDSKFIKDVSSAVPVWHTRSGHMLAFATLNGDKTNSGYFIVDTGASGFVIEPTAADKLDLESFGEVHVTGMAGKIKGKFRRAGKFQLGPLEVRDAVMMEMNCGGLVTGAPGPVIGIVG